MEGKRIGVWLPVLLILVGAALLAAGVWRGEVQTVVSKATKICLECIGIG